MLPTPSIHGFPKPQSPRCTYKIVKLVNYYQYHVYGSPSLTEALLSLLLPVQTSRQALCYSNSTPPSTIVLRDLSPSNAAFTTSSALRCTSSFPPLVSTTHTSPSPPFSGSGSSSASIWLCTMSAFM